MHTAGAVLVGGLSRPGSAPAPAPRGVQCTVLSVLTMQMLLVDHVVDGTFGDSQ